jgi:Resolvase, N terminal domain
MNPKITEHHRSKPAYVYVRQSTLAQVRHHQESTERQYALREKAQELGWSEPAIRILDRDLGMSGAQTTGRDDFKTLVAEVSMGQVGAVFALEASRLARSNLDWHRLLQLCALTETLVIDEDGCRVGGGALARWPPSAAQTARAVFPHAAFTKTHASEMQSKGLAESS